MANTSYKNSIESYLKFCEKNSESSQFVSLIHEVDKPFIAIYYLIDRYHWQVANNWPKLDFKKYISENSSFLELLKLNKLHITHYYDYMYEAVSQWETDDEEPDEDLFLSNKFGLSKSEFKKVDNNFANITKIKEFFDKKLGNKLLKMSPGFKPKKIKPIEPPKALPTRFELISL